MPTCSRVRQALFPCALILVAATAAWAQSPATISFRALTDAGQLVLDLKPADISLKVDGKAREVRSLELVTIGGGRAAGPAPSRPPFASNTAADAGRDVILVIDDESIAPGKEQPVQDALRQLVGKLAPSDRVGLLSLRIGGASIPASTDRGTIGKAVDGLKGEGAVSESTADFQCRTSQILQSVGGLLAGATDAKTTLVLVSSGIAPLPPAESRSTLGTSSGLCQLRAPHFAEVGKAAAGSPAPLYIIYVVDGRATASSEAQAGLENLAGVVDAPLIRLTGNSPSVLNRIADETSAYYVGAFEPEATERNGGAHKAELRVNRAGVKLEAGNSLIIARSGGKAPSPKDMLRDTNAYRDLPLRAAAWAMRDAGSNKLKVIALFEPADPAVKLTSAMIALVDGNRIAAQWTAQGAELERVPVMAALPVTAGNYRMRVAAIDASGRAGAVDYPLQAEMTAAGPLTLSALTLGVAQNGFAPRLLFGPADQSAAGYLEIYGVPKGANVTGTIELAPSEDAPAMATTPATIRPAAAEDMRVVFGGFSIGGLQPGDHVMRIVVSLDGKVVGRAMRTMRKSAR